MVKYTSSCWWIFQSFPLVPTTAVPAVATLELLVEMVRYTHVFSLLNVSVVPTSPTTAFPAVATLEQWLTWSGIHVFLLLNVSLVCTSPHNCCPRCYHIGAVVNMVRYSHIFLLQYVLVVPPNPHNCCPLGATLEQWLIWTGTHMSYCYWMLLLFPLVSTTAVPIVSTLKQTVNMARYTRLFATERFSRPH